MREEHFTSAAAILQTTRHLTAPAHTACPSSTEPAAAMDTSEFVPFAGSSGKKKKQNGRQQGLAMQQQSL
jgi:hypothetical protein